MYKRQDVLAQQVTLTQLHFDVTENTRMRIGMEGVHREHVHLRFYLVPTPDLLAMGVHVQHAEGTPEQRVDRHDISWLPSLQLGRGLAKWCSLGLQHTCVLMTWHSRAPALAVRHRMPQSPLTIDC